ncbi:MAG: hypothetical protein EZS28_032825 [Streblomastix strix]|uniref:Uncharacterized protein n=1 Tax=Streblomastix strix TaxID=222440 RepID=A0A5J4UMK7_9EUKA|nr:MAG: hypothetical protein EZS28_032825 [Streblomastix strix]
MEESLDDRLRYYHDRFPSSLAFLDWKNKAYSLEQRELEYVVEKITNDCAQLLQDRQHKHLTQSTNTLPIPVVVPDMRRLRGDREICLRAASEVKFPEPPLVEADLYLQEKTTIDLAKVQLSCKMGALLFWQYQYATSFPFFCYAYRSN